MKTPFYKLALGTRFKYNESDDDDAIWVKLSTNIIAGWDEDLKTDNWIGQHICCFSESEDLTGEVYVL